MAPLSLCHTYELMYTVCSWAEPMVYTYITVVIWLEAYSYMEFKITLDQHMRYF